VFVFIGAIGDVTCFILREGKEQWMVWTVQVSIAKGLNTYVNKVFLFPLCHYGVLCVDW
jgi:hypothetical protein